MTKYKVLSLLENAGDNYISGEEIAAELNISRAAVWKSIRALREDGADITAVPNRGYLLHGPLPLSEEGIRNHLKSSGVDLSVYRCVDSTNRMLKEAAAAGAPEFTVIAAEQQTAGRGRLGRSFYSPTRSGVYLSILLRPSFPAGQAGLLTAGAAVAAAEAIEKVSGRTAAIKWVNDILIDGRKVCGILTEASVDCENGGLSYAVVGIGINVCPPSGGFPEEIASVAGSVFPEAPAGGVSCALTAAVIDGVIGAYRSLGSEETYRSYLSHSCVIGKDVYLISAAGGREEAHIRGIDRNFALIAELPDGSEKRVSGGEISLRFQ